MSEVGGAEYYCSACKKEVKSVVVQCKTCVQYFYHPGCVSKHRAYKGQEYIKCEGPFHQIVIERDRMDGKRTVADRERTVSVGSTGSTGSTSGNTSKQSNMDIKIDWLIKTVKDIKDEITCRSEIKTLIKQIIRVELVSFKQDIVDLKRSIQVITTNNTTNKAENEIKSYSDAAKDKKKESILIVKPKKDQESEATKKLVKEKVDIKNLGVGITKIKKRGKGSIILGCESEKEIKRLKDTVCEKLGEDFEIAEPKKRKPKIKIVNVNEEEMNLDDENLIDAILKQNEINREEEGFHIRVVKKIIKARKNVNERKREEGSLLLEVDKATHERMLNKEKINIGWRKCFVFDYFNVKRCYKCWGYYHIAKNCTRQETCFKYAGNHKANDCTTTKKRCVNCMHKIKMYNLKINDEHEAVSVECPTYIRALEEEKKRTGWDSTL
ncbi:uncharacterized protein LOC143214708 [Lasioglossum baleicum]|uniref:uncharacterized protein LOC143214708 n=1 Tax=Lasioglossum baleicum TaxID=434251 RepID=UPI003FCD8CDE